MRSISQLLEELDDQSMSQVQRFCRQARGAIDAYEAKRLAAAMADAADTRSAARMAAAGGKRTKHQANKAAKRAAAVKRNSKIADDLESGKLSTDQADAIADAAAKSDGEAACDDELIDSIADNDADQAKRITDEWLERRATEQNVADEHNRQRRARRAASYYDGNKGLRAIKLEGDNATLAEFWTRIEQRERQLWNSDGGRDIAPSKHARTRDQRLFDAAVELLLGTGTPGSSSAKPAAVISVTAERPSVMVGEGPIPDDVALELLGRSSLFVNLMDMSGQTMWFGRLRRNASLSQFIALAVRDRGCVLCGHHWSKCQAHHTMPWNSPAAGKTNIDELVLLCESCHHEVHDMGRTTIERADGTWTTRPALAHELAPKRPQRLSDAKRSRRPSRAAGAAAPVATTHRRPTSSAASPHTQPGSRKADDEAA